MGKEVKLSAKSTEKKEVKLSADGTNDDLVVQLKEEEINVKNSKSLRNELKKISHNDLLGFIILFNDHNRKKIGVFSSIDQGVSQFVALAHGGYIDQYDQIINNVITTRTIERMQKREELDKLLEEHNEQPKAGEGQVSEDATDQQDGE